MSSREHRTFLTRSSVVLQRSSTMRTKLMTSLRVLPVALLVAGFGASALPAGATGYHCPPAGDARVSIDANVDTSTTVNASADGGTASASSNGGDGNIVFVVGGSAKVGSGGEATADAKGGMVSIGTVDGGHNTGATISVDDTKGGMGCGAYVPYGSYASLAPQSKGGDASVDITANVTSDTSVNASANGGTATATSNGGNGNVVIDPIIFGAPFLPLLGSTATVGSGGPATATAKGGTIAIGAVNGGHNRGATIQVGNTIGGSGLHGGDATVRIQANVQSSTSVNASADGGTASASSNGGDFNGAIVGSGSTVQVGTGGPASADASGGTVSIDSVDGGHNTGATITVGNTIGGSGVNGGDATVDIQANVETSTTVTASADGGTATAESNGGSNNGALAGDGSTVEVGNGGPATADASGGSVTIGTVDGGDNTGPTITVDDTQGN